MKLLSMIFQLLCILALMQSGLVSASSFHTTGQASSNAEMSCHHHEMNMIDANHASCSSSSMSSDSCCKVLCQCSFANCTAASFIIPVTTGQISRVDLTTTLSVYAFVIPQTAQTSLFRPPINS